MVNKSKKKRKTRPECKFRVDDLVQSNDFMSYLGRVRALHWRVDQRRWVADIEGDEFNYARWEDDLLLLHRPQPSDAGATEYDEIMLVQSCDT